MKKIYALVTRKFVDSDLMHISSRLNESIELIIPSAYDNATLLDCINRYPISAFLGTVPDSAVLNAARDLKLVQIPWNGVDNANIPVATQTGAVVCNSHSNASAVAEMAVALMFALVKWIPLHDRALREGDWRRPNGMSRFVPPEKLFGKSVGLIGYGFIGHAIFNLLKGFAMRFSAVSRTGIDRFNSGVDMYGLDGLKCVLLSSDIIILALPLTPHTRGLISAEQFNWMKKTAFLINVSRADIVNEKDLYDALSSGRIAGAAIDVWYKTPSRGKSHCIPGRYPFHELDNLILSPHRSGFLKDSLLHLEDAVENLNRLAENKSFINVVNTVEGY